MDEKDLSCEKNWLYAKMAERAVASLKKNHFDAHFATSHHEAVNTILGMIPENSIIGFADSVTLDQIGLFDQLPSRKPAEILQPMLHNEKGDLIHSPQEMFELQRRVLTSDVYICGTNAITLDGKLVLAFINQRNMLWDAWDVYPPYALTRLIIVLGTSQHGRGRQQSSADDIRPETNHLRSRRQ